MQSILQSYANVHKRRYQAYTRMCSGVNGQIRPRLDLHKNVAGSKNTRDVHLASFLMH